jgi:endonuclease I
MKRILPALLLCLSPLSAFSLAPEPANQPTGLLFASVKTYGFVLSFTTTTADGYLVLKSDKPITDVPADGTTYEKGQGLSSCKVLYVGANNILNVREVLENTTYYIKVFAYNGTASNTNYLQTNPLSGNTSTPSADAGSYYSGIDSSAGWFVSSLHDLINTHIQNTYTPGYVNTMVATLYERDTTTGRCVVNCEYSNETTVYTPPFTFNGQQYNREHVLCKSWMQTAAIYGANNLIDYPEGSDYFNLLLTRSTPNQSRSNHPEGEVVTVTTSYGESKYGKDSNGNTCFEPKEDRKGDVARAMMYEMVSYDGLEGGWGLDELLSEAPDQSQAVLKQWNMQDPPDKFERTKNDYIFSLQHNRNPFIDHPNWANCINFDSLIKTNLCGALTGITEANLNAGLNIYPNPTANILNVDLLAADFTGAAISVYNIYGQVVSVIETTTAKSALDVSALEQGNYILKISIGEKSAYRKFLIVR